MAEATKSRARFSGHGNSKGAAGFRTEGDGSEGEFLSGPGETAIINPQEGGFDAIRIGAAWDNIPVQQSGFLGKLLKKTMRKGVDLDLGCLYELHDGQRGAIWPSATYMAPMMKSPISPCPVMNEQVMPRVMMNISSSTDSTGRT